MSEPLGPGSSLARRLFAWSAERFPVPGALAYGGTLFAAAYAAGSLLPDARPFAWRDLALGVVTGFLFLLQLRILDEHKDLARDRVAWPDRVLSRGLVTLRHLQPILVMAVLGQTACAARLGRDAFWAWLAVVAWSWLMYREFFAGELLRRRLGIQLLTHQAVVPLLAAFGLAARAPAAGLATPDAWVSAGGLAAATIAYEIARKTWSPDREHPQAESYTRAWGRPAAVAAGAIAAILATGAFLWLARGAGPAALLLLATPLGPFLWAQARFLARPDRARSRAVETAGALFMIGTFLVAAVALGR